MATKTKAADFSEVHGPEPTNAAAPDIERELPYVVEFTLEGVCPILFHAWNNEAVAEKGAAKKGSAAKKTDNVESYVYRDAKGDICLPGVYVHSSMQYAAKFRQDPRSTRKSAFDLFKAAVSPLTELASLGSAKWDYIDSRRVTVQRNGITRQRPAFNAGWRASFQFVVNLPEYVSPAFFQDVLTLAGRVIGVADFRPTYGRFHIVRFDVLDL
jgi:hypothetical protein